MPAGIGGGGYVIVALEATNGTYVQPGTAADIYVPILDETFKYTSEPYFSPQLRQQTIVSDVKQGYYHVEGDIHMEVDPRFLPYFLYASRHNISKTGTTYTFTPGSQGSTSTAATGTVQRTMSVTISRNNVLFGYAGCTAGGYEFTIEDGVLKVTFNMLGLSDNTVSGTPAPAWVAPDLFGADAMQSVLLLPVLHLRSVQHRLITTGIHLEASSVQNPRTALGVIVAQATSASARLWLTLRLSLTSLAVLSTITTLPLLSVQFSWKR